LPNFPKSPKEVPWFLEIKLGSMLKKLILYEKIKVLNVEIQSEAIIKH